MIVLKAPFSKGSKGRNPSAIFAPDRIIEQTKDIYLNESGLSHSIRPVDIDFDKEDAASAFASIKEAVGKQSFSEKVCLLGGDHSVTYASFSAFAKKNPGAGIVILDAHPDCDSGENIPSHADFVRKLVTEGVVDRSRIVFFGLRNIEGEEKEFLDSNRIKYFTMKQVMMTGFVNSVDGLTENISQWHSLYLSIDIDVADPSCAPGTGYLEPGGLSARQLINIIQRIRLLKNLKMFDIVEVGPDKDLNDMTSKLAAKLLCELC